MNKSNHKLKTINEENEVSIVSIEMTEFDNYKEQDDSVENELNKSETESNYPINTYIEHSQEHNALLDCCFCIILIFCFLMILIFAFI